MSLFGLFRRKPKGIDNPYDYYPDIFQQDSSLSITTSDSYYDMLHFSSHEDSIIREVIKTVNKKYPSKYRAIGLANESYSIVYKPRYILFDVIIIVFGESKKPLDKIAVSFAYIQKGASYRKDAIQYFESAIDHVALSELDKFSSISVLSMLNAIMETYEKEHDYKKAIHWANILIKRNAGNAPYYKDKIVKLKEKDKNWKPLRQRKVSDRQLQFDQQTYEAALQYAPLLEK